MNSICRRSWGAASADAEVGSENPPKLFGPAWLSVTTSMRTVWMPSVNPETRYTPGSGFASTTGAC